MLNWITLILICQISGEAVAALTGLPVPGPVIGMVILFVGLLVFGSVPEGLSAVADGLLRNLSLLFVPAGVGVVLHAQLLANDWLPISLALLVSTLSAIAVTALLMTWLTPRQSRDTGQTFSDG